MQVVFQGKILSAISTSCSLSPPPPAIANLNCFFRRGVERIRTVTPDDITSVTHAVREPRAHTQEIVVGAERERKRKKAAVLHILNTGGEELFTCALPGRIHKDFHSFLAHFALKTNEGHFKQESLSDS